MKEARLQWRSRTNGIDPARFRFIDESGAKTNMVRLYGRCEQGQRLLSKAPAGHWQTTTMTDLLAWRAVLKTLHPFLAAELGRQFDFARSLELGMLPLVVGTAEPLETLKSYASLYLREEVQAEGLVQLRPVPGGDELFARIVAERWPVSARSTTIQAIPIVRQPHVPIGRLDQEVWDLLVMAQMDARLAEERLGLRGHVAEGIHAEAQHVHRLGSIVAGTVASRQAASCRRTGGELCYRSGIFVL